MTRNEHINKLAHAIKEYRGACNAETMLWLPGQSPKPKRVTRICKYLFALKLDIQTSMDVIRKFKTRDELYLWLKKI